MTDLTPPSKICQFHPETECLYPHKCFSLGCRNDPIEAEKRYPTPPVWLQQQADLTPPPMQPSAQRAADIIMDDWYEIAVDVVKRGDGLPGTVLGGGWPEDEALDKLRDMICSSITAARAALIAELREPGASVCEHLSEVCWQNNGWGIEVKVLLGALADLLEKRRSGGPREPDAA